MLFVPLSSNDVFIYNVDVPRNNSQSNQFSIKTLFLVTDSFFIGKKWVHDNSHLKTIPKKDRLYILSYGREAIRELESTEFNRCTLNSNPYHDFWCHCLHFRHASDEMFNCWMTRSKRPSFFFKKSCNVTSLICYFWCRKYEAVSCFSPRQATY